MGEGARVELLDELAVGLDAKVEVLTRPLCSLGEGLDGQRGGFVPIGRVADVNDRRPQVRPTRLEQPADGGFVERPPRRVVVGAGGRRDLSEQQDCRRLMRKPELEVGEGRLEGIGLITRPLAARCLGLGLGLGSGLGLGFRCLAARCLPLVECTP